MAIITFVRVGTLRSRLATEWLWALIQIIQPPALMVGRVVINLSFFTADGLRSALRGPTVDDGYEIDVCICEIDSHWELLQAHKDKEAIDLDEWTEPPWQETRMCAAVGYADEHKTTQGGQVATPMPVVIAELQSKLSAEAREFTLSSTLDEPHGMHFSGMSGGPIIGLWGEADYKPIGLIFEGYPSSGDAPASELVGPNDILVRGLLLTPERFNSWLLAITPA